MTAVRHTKISRFLSFALRHHPEKLGLQPDTGGWVDVAALLHACKSHAMALSLEELKVVVVQNDKKRFSLNTDCTLIRANQGHSITVDLGLQPQQPPTLLYHGTAARFLPAILKKGIVKGRRQHVHLSLDSTAAINVGKRHGKPVVLKIDSARMHKDGYVFYCSENGIWLTNNVPVIYLSKNSPPFSIPRVEVEEFEPRE